MGRKRYCYLFDEARDLVRGEKIGSRQQYYDWHKLHKPARIPKRPDRSYPKEWVSWNDFLGNNNVFPSIRRHFRPYTDARTFAHTLNMKNKAQWIKYAKSANKPMDIPSRPDVYYNKTGDWFTWGAFLGYNIVDRVSALNESPFIFYILNYKDTPQNVYKFGITNGGVSSIKNEWNTHKNFKVIRLYDCVTDFQWKEIVNAKCPEYTQTHIEDQFIVPSIYDLLYDLEGTNKIDVITNYS